MCLFLVKKGILIKSLVFLMHKKMLEYAYSLVSKSFAYLKKVARFMLSMVNAS